MKLFVLYVFLVSGSLASANVSVSLHSLNFDGCYQILNPRTGHPSVCLRGTTEEGIGGSGARLAVFATHTATIQSCFKSSGIKISPEEFRFQVDGKDRLIFSNIRYIGRLVTGDGRVADDDFYRPGFIDVKFVKLGEEESRRLQAIADVHSSCQ